MSVASAATAVTSDDIPATVVTFELIPATVVTLEETPATVVIFALIPARVVILADCAATVPVSATFHPTTASPDVSWKARYLLRRDDLVGNVILAVASD